MARIRSLHPGLYTDEAFATVSMAARVLFPGIWTECDDYGCFEWKPVRLKMRLFPNDNVNVSDLLDELAENKMLMKYEVDGKQYGAVRNFTRFQRPRRPSSFCPRTEEVGNWVGLTNPATEGCTDNVGSDPPLSEPIPANVGKGSAEGRKEGKEEGRKVDSEPSGSGASARKPTADDLEIPAFLDRRPDPVKTLFDLGVQHLTAKGSTEKQARSLLGKWRKGHGDAETLRAVQASTAADASEPVAFIERTLRPAAKVSDVTAALQRIPT